jgi:hypothetical protein
MIKCAISSFLTIRARNEHPPDRQTEEFLLYAAYQKRHSRLNPSLLVDLVQFVLCGVIFLGITVGAAVSR